MGGNWPRQRAVYRLLMLEGLGATVYHGLPSNADKPNRDLLPALAQHHRSHSGSPPSSLTLSQPLFLSLSNNPIHKSAMLLVQRHIIDLGVIMFLIAPCQVHIEASVTFLQIPELVLYIPDHVLLCLTKTR